MTRRPTPLLRRALGPRRATSPSSSLPPILKTKPEPSDPAQSLFNPDAPFSFTPSRRRSPAALTATFAADTEPFTIAGASGTGRAGAKARIQAPSDRRSRGRPSCMRAAIVVVAGGGACASRYADERQAAHAGDGHARRAVESRPVSRCSSTASITARRRRGCRYRPAHTFSSSAGAACRASSRQRHRRRGSLAVSRVREHAGDRQPARRDAAGGRQGHRRRHRSRRRAGDHQRPPAGRPRGRPADADRVGAARRVSVQAGGTASIVTPVASAATAAGPVSGWLTVKAPFSLEIREEGRVVGTTDADRVDAGRGPARHRARERDARLPRRPASCR